MSTKKKSFSCQLVVHLISISLYNNTIKYNTIKYSTIHISPSVQYTLYNSVQRAKSYPLETRSTKYPYFSLAISRSKNVPMFGPPIPASALFSKNSAFTKFLLTKIINAEQAAHRQSNLHKLAQFSNDATQNDAALQRSQRKMIVSLFCLS